jgi:hypothetical protein
MRADKLNLFLERGPVLSECILNSGCNLLHICGVVLDARWHVESMLLEDVLSRAE